MPTPSFLPDEEVSPGDRRRRPSWWRRALAALLRSLGRTSRPGQYRDLAPRRFGGAGRGGDEI